MASVASPRRGLVLGGGGILGAAWMVGALKAVEEIHGFDPRTADYIVGTSAGSVLSALLGAGVSVEQLIDNQRGNSITAGPLAGYTWDYEKATGGHRPGLPRLLGPGSGKLIRRSLAGRARRMPPTAVLSAFLPVGKGSLERVGHLVEAFTPFGEWSPHDNVWIVALDYESGRRVAFGHDNAPRVPLSEAVMASCAIPGWFRPMTIDGRTYIDGGAWSATSADLLAGLDLDEVYVLAPMLSFAMDQPGTVLGRVERRWRVQVTKRCLTEVDKVRAGGAAVTILGPGPEDLEAMGANVMDNSRRLGVLETSLRTSVEALRDPDRVGPDHLADVQLIRAYVPSTLPEVQAWYQAGAVPAGTRIDVVTASLRELHPGADDEELEFLATKAAEEVSTVAAMTSGRRRATLAVDLGADAATRVPGESTAMTTLVDVPVAAWAALFVDDLEWYAVDEIPHLQ